MKNLIAFLLVFLSSFLYADVESPRYDDESVHLGLPSWVTFSGGETIEYPEATTTSLRRADIHLPESHYVNLMGETYKTLRVDNWGNVYFVPEQERKDSLWFGLEFGLNNNDFTWKAYDGNENDDNNINQDPLMIVINQNFKRGRDQYVVQYVIYTDGELQIQLWRNGGYVREWPSWFSPIYFDGTNRYTTSRLPYIGTMELLGPNGLRPGWIAKSLVPSDADDILFEMSQNGKGLHISVDGSSKDLGGIIAYDNSREHPVVGSFSAIDIQTEGFPDDDFLPFKCWYFKEFYGTNSANYPLDKSFSKGISSFTLTRDDFQYTWNAYMYNSRKGKDDSFLPLLTENEIAFIKAPAIKFQRVGSPSGTLLRNFDFYITSIKYHLDQLPSVQFLPTRTKAFLKIRNEDGGRFETPEAKGEYDKKSGYTVYEMFNNQNVMGTITSFPGNVIDKISVIRKGCYDHAEIGGEKIPSYVCNVELKKISDEKVEFNASVFDGTTVFSITYKKCSKRELTIIPEIQKTEVYMNTANGVNVYETASIMNAFGNVIQKQEKISSDKFAVSTSYSNKLNQTTFSPMTFIHKNPSGDFEYVDLACKNCIGLANSYYAGQNPIDQPDALGFAYSEVDNLNGKGGAINSVAGIAKRSFAYQTENNIKTWSIPVQSEDDFIPFEKLEEWQIEKKYNDNIGLAYNKNYTLTIIRGDDGKYTQKITDSDGLLKSSWIYNGSNAIINLYEYDEYGHLKEQKLKNDLRLVEKSTYDAQGRLKTSESNDRGLNEYKYDSFGRLRYTRNAMQKKKGEFSVLFYDEYGRTVALGVASAGENDFNNTDGEISEDKIRYVSKTIYGKPDALILRKYVMDQNLINEILTSMDNIRPSDISLKASFDGEGHVAKVVMSSYDVEGMCVDRWIVLGLKGFPAIRLHYEYDDAKKPIKTSYSLWENGAWNEKTQRTRSYDNKGKLMWIKENNEYLAKYTYTENGNISQKEYFDKGSSVMKKSINIDVYGRVTDVIYKDDAGKEIYSTKLGFFNDLTNKVLSSKHSWNDVLNGGDFERIGLYSYDYNDRLTTVVGSFAASYEYDDIGRMSKKVEGNDGIEFSYSNPSYRPSGYSVNGESDEKNVEYFRYDASGNIWYDKHNKVVYKNSELGQPLKITSFSVMPDQITLDDVYEVKGKNNFANVEAVVDVAYDESGNRLWYSVDNRVRNEKWIMVTLPGIGKFKSSNPSAAMPLYEFVQKDLVSGGYRDAADNIHLPILDAQGSVRGFVSSQGLESAYDYYPYGTVIDVSPNGGDDNRRWQSKEFDNEHGKYYFGSRYLDPFFGMWMSPDPAGQFANPYTYGGDPINFADPNGEEVITAGVIVTAAIVGAIIGGATAVYQCTKYGAGSCSVGITQGTVVGAAAGAAGAAAGGAVAGLAAGAGEGAIGGGFAGGAASSATSYIGNGLFTGDMSFGEGFRQTMIGAFSGAISGGFGASLELSDTDLGWAGRTGGELLGSAASSVFNTAISGGGSFEDFMLNMGKSMAMGLTSSILTGYIDSYVNGKDRYDYTDVNQAGLQAGDVLAFGVEDGYGVKGWAISRSIMTASGEPYSHIAVVDYGLDKGGDYVLGIREANNNGTNEFTPLSTIKEKTNHPYNNRKFKILGNKSLNKNYTTLKSQKYGFVQANCAKQASLWTNMPIRNNPGAFARMMLGQSIYYNSASLRSIMW